LKELI
jgi:hypothetical protein